MQESRGSLKQAANFWRRCDEFLVHDWRILAVLRPRMNPISPKPTVVVPLTFPELNYGHSKVSDLVESSCSASKPTSLLSWGFRNITLDSQHKELPTDRGVVMGCEDGTLYIFLPSENLPTDLHVPVDTQFLEANNFSRSSSRLARLSSPTSRSSSTSSLHLHQTPFHLAPRSPVVSGVTTEQVEAPKNFVDFDDEPEKLMEMLKGRSPRDKTFAEVLPLSFERGLAPPSPVPLAPKRREDPRSLLSATNSPAFTPQVLQPSSSSKVMTQVSFSSRDLSLRCHIIPSCSGPGRSVVGMQTLDNIRLIIVLQQTGHLSIFKMKDGSCIVTTQVQQPALHPPVGIKDREMTHAVWIWTRLQAFDMGESTMLVACAKTDVNSPTPPSVDSQDGKSLERSCIAIFDCRSLSEERPWEVVLDKIGEWQFDGLSECVGLHLEFDKYLTFLYISQGHLVTQKLRFLPRLPLPTLEAKTHESQAHNLSSLPLPNPFKGMISKSTDHVPLKDKRELGRVEADQEYDAGEILASSSVSGLRTRTVGSKQRGIVWSDQELAMFDYENRSLCRLFVTPISNVKDSVWIDDDSYMITFADRAELHKLKNVDANNDEVVNEVCVYNVQSQLVYTITLAPYQMSHVASASEILSTTVEKDGRRRLESFVSTPKMRNGSNKTSRTLWKASWTEGHEPSSKSQLTSLLPFEPDAIFLGYSDGRLRQSSFSEMVQTPSRALTCENVSDPPLDGFLAGLHVTQNSRTKDRFILGGADDGSIAFWAFDSLKLCARWIKFTTPLTNVIQFTGEKVGPLDGCVLCISRDGTIAVIAVDGFQYLYLIPGSVAPLEKICLMDNNLLLMYADGRARLWDIKTKEFWRSMGADKAEELLGQGGWMISSVEDHSGTDTVLSALHDTQKGVDSAATLSLDLERFVTETATLIRSITSLTGATQKRTLAKALDRIRLVLSTLITPGLSDEIDGVCQRLGIRPSTVSVGFSKQGSTSIYNEHRPQDAWCISPDVSAARALAITVVLRVLALFEDYTEDSNTVISFYAMSLASVIGALYQAPSLPYLARHWFEASNELRQAARTLFDAAVIRLSDEETILVAERWQQHLPCLQPTADIESMPAALALFICGYIAAEKYSLFSLSALTDISKSIDMYLHDEKSKYRVLAIDLCSRGFHVWQHSIDAMKILRALFVLATNTRKEAITAQNVGAHARLAVLQIASNDTQLFMTTLALDILDSRSVDYRKSVMQVVAFLIRKRPLVLYPNLSRLMEAVVKSLDPNSTTSREAVLDAATEILGHVVKTFPTIDFHMTSQRLAVGTGEGAIIMYDLKTATRLYVLEGHTKRLSACSFSPDGRRLVTVSLEESVVLVWKVGASFSSFFNPGAPPRQGHGGSLPFKTLSFNIGDEHMTIAETLEWVRFEWPAERSVKLKIRENVLTFST